MIVVCFGTIKNFPLAKIIPSSIVICVPKPSHSIVPFTLSKTLSFLLESLVSTKFSEEKKCLDILSVPALVTFTYIVFGPVESLIVVASVPSATV